VGSNPTPSAVSPIRSSVRSADGLDQFGEAPRLLRRGEVATRKLGGPDRIAEPLASQVQLPSLEPVFAAAYDVDRHRFPKLRDDAPQIPAGGVLAMLIDEGSRGVQCADPVPPADRPISLLELGRSSDGGGLCQSRRSRIARRRRPPAVSAGPTHGRPCGGGVQGGYSIAGRAMAGGSRPASSQPAAAAASGTPTTMRTR
jgi:hypothetical protein